MVNNDAGKSHTQDIQHKERLDERRSDATSGKTLKDLEKAEKEPTSADSDSKPGPSPDGSLDESRELNDAGPI